MTLTLQTIEAHIRNALGGDSSVEGNGRSIANQAGHYFTDMHPWRTMERLARLNLRASVTISNWTWTESSRTLADSAVGALLANYALVQGDEFQLTAGTGATVGFYPIQTRSSANAFVLETSIGSGADGQADIDGTITTRTIALPSDFRQLISRPRSIGSTRSLNIVSMEEVDKLRAGDSSTSDTGYAAALMWKPSAQALGGAPVPVLEVWPTPGTNANAAFSIHYRATWSDLSDDSDIAQIPSMFAMEMLYLQVVRAVALGYEEFDVATMSQRVEELKAGPLFRDACAADGSVQTSFGQQRGGAAQVEAFESIGAGNFTFLPPS